MFTVFGGIFFNDVLYIFHEVHFYCSVYRLTMWKTEMKMELCTDFNYVVKAG